MEIMIEAVLLELAILIIKKTKIEKKLRQTFKCMLRKCFTCCGMKNIEQELIFLNEAINELKNKIETEKQRKSSLITSI
tara:strand:- start:72 stop:308 length:237 start_codon:yes stop_codon:yes gene_type:complete